MKKNNSYKPGEIDGLLSCIRSFLYLESQEQLEDSLEKLKTLINGQMDFIERLEVVLTDLIKIAERDHDEYDHTDINTHGLTCMDCLVIANGQALLNSMSGTGETNGH